MLPSSGGYLNLVTLLSVYFVRRANPFNSLRRQLFIAPKNIYNNRGRRLVRRTTAKFFPSRAFRRWREKTNFYFFSTIFVRQKIFRFHSSRLLGAGDTTIEPKWLKIWEIIENNTGFNTRVFRNNNDETTVMTWIIIK